MEKEKTSLFKKIDHFLFQQIDTFKTGPAYLKFQELTSSLEEDIQKFINNGLLALILLFPFFFVLLFFQSNRELSAELKTKKEILTSSKNFISLKNQINMAGRVLIAPQAISTKSLLDAKIRALATRLHIGLDKITTQNFNISQDMSQFQKTEADVQFTRLSLPELSQLLENLVNMEKVKISAITIRRNEATELLDGSFHIVQLAQAPEETY